MHDQVDRAAIFKRILERNALRREAQLPLLDVRAIYDQEVARARWQAHRDTHFDTVHAEVAARIRERLGPGKQDSVGTRWRIHVETNRELRRRFCAARP